MLFLLLPLHHAPATLRRRLGQHRPLDVELRAQDSLRQPLVGDIVEVLSLDRLGHLEFEIGEHGPERWLRARVDHAFAHGRTLWAEGEEHQHARRRTLGSVAHQDEHRFRVVSLFQRDCESASGTLRELAVDVEALRFDRHEHRAVLRAAQRTQGSFNLVSGCEVDRRPGRFARPRPAHEGAEPPAIIDIDIRRVLRSGCAQLALREAFAVCERRRAHARHETAGVGAQRLAKERAAAPDVRRRAALLVFLATRRGVVLDEARVGELGGLAAVNVARVEVRRGQLTLQALAPRGVEHPILDAGGIRDVRDDRPLLPTRLLHEQIARAASVADEGRGLEGRRLFKQARPEQRKGLVHDSHAVGHERAPIRDAAERLG
mmetsp:Transcript_4450/g.11387  ORF Transcript_4450/g.11387 Transcript_4450/m.11387 type:complete len:376 (-) Transcript_4450:74-1201(-)